MMFFGNVSRDTSPMIVEVSLETSPKNIMIQDMINSKTVRLYLIESKFLTAGN